MIFLSGKNQNQTNTTKKTIDIKSDTEDKNYLIEKRVPYANVSNFLETTRYLLKNVEQYKDEFEMLGVNYKNFMQVWDEEGIDWAIDRALEDGVIRLDKESNKFVLATERERLDILDAQKQAMPDHLKKDIENSEWYSSVIRKWKEKYGSLDRLPL